MQFGSAGLLERLREGATVVTPSRLLASVLTHQFAQQQLESGLASWPRPAVYSLDAWLTSCWVEARYTRGNVPVLLSPSQERLLWKSLIAKEHPELFDANAAARLASEASKAIAEWDISTEDSDWQFSGDSQQFYMLLDLFRQRCRAENWMTRAEIWSFLPKWIAASGSRPAKTIFAGFATIPAALRRIVDAPKLDASFEPIPPGLPGKNITARAFTNFSAEVEFAARWAREVFENAGGRSIGIFVPELAGNRALVERTFEQVFHPSAGIHNRFGRTTPASADSVFHVADPKRLDTHPLIANARLILELVRPRIRTADASAILRCPWIAGADEERSARALADAELRRHRDLDVTLHDLEYASRNCLLLGPVWTRIRKTLRDVRQRLELSAWSELFGDLLAAAGWPGSLNLTAEEQQIIEAWKESLSDLASLALVAGQVSLEVALSQLDEVLSNRGWERGDWFSPVQILDAADAFGLHFDFAAATGLSEEEWPPLVGPLPFIPLALQRNSQFPGSDPQKIRREYHQKTESLFRSAPEMVATFSDRLAPIARKFVRVSKREVTVWSGALPRDSYPVVSLDTTEDSRAPAFRATEAAYGGTGILKAQSLCPFRSFAENRLRAVRPEDACFGFDARDRGSFLHAAMEQVWRELRSLKNLRSLERDEMQQLVRDAVAVAVKDDESSPLHQLATETERARLESLILEWLDLEKSRKQPFTAEHVEERRSFEIAGLHLRLRVDRIDRLDDGSVVLIDYKSGEQKAKNLAGDRPVEPQLLVYAAALEERVEGIFFAQVKPRDLKAIGFSRSEHFPAKTRASGSARSDWDEYIAQSRAAVEKLASDFVAGHAAVDPLPDACTFCNQKPLCRVLEQSSPEEEEDGD